MAEALTKASADRFEVRVTADSYFRWNPYPAQPPGGVSTYCLADKSGWTPGQ
jgi:hypothetical protein